MKSIGVDALSNNVGVFRFLFLCIVLFTLLNGEEIEVDVHNAEHKTVCYFSACKD